MFRNILKRWLNTQPSVQHNSGQPISPGPLQIVEISGFKLHSPLGLLAGNGSFPTEFVRAAKHLGIDVVVAAQEGEADPALACLAKDLIWIKVGQIGRMLEFFLQHGVKELALVGGVTKTNLFKNFRPDAKGLAVLARAGGTGDDTVMRALAAEMREHEIHVIPAHIFTPKCLTKRGIISKRGLSEAEFNAAKIGWLAAGAMGSHDIGQTVIVNRGTVVAVEAVEGTDQAIFRAGQLSGPGSVVIKRSKPIQDLRFDLPVIGKKTIQSMIKAKATALVLEAERTLLFDEDTIRRTADEADLAVVAMTGLDLETEKSEYQTGLSNLTRASGQVEEA